MFEIGSKIYCFYIDVKGNLQVIMCEDDDRKLNNFENRPVKVMQEQDYQSLSRDDKIRFANQFI